MRLSSRHAASLAAAGALVAAMSVVPTAAQAQDQRIEDGIHHYIECFRFMLTDEASHIAFCSPSRVGEWFVPESNYSGITCTFPETLVLFEDGVKRCALTS